MTIGTHLKEQDKQLHRITTMKILILRASGRPQGFSHRLAEEFEKGAAESGHNVENYDCTLHNVRGCLGCNFCAEHDGVCGQKDDFADIAAKMTDADILVFAFPVYYFGVPGQLTTIIDRTYSLNFAPKPLSDKKSALLISQGQPSLAPTFPVFGMCREIEKAYNWTYCGEVIAKGLNAFVPLDTIDSMPCLEEAYQLGKSLK